MRRAGALMDRKRRRQKFILAAVSFCALFALFALFYLWGPNLLHAGESYGAATAGGALSGEDFGAVTAGGAQSGEGRGAVPGKALKPRKIPEDWSFTIISTGDIMMHSPQTRAGRLPDGGGYDFSFMFEKVAPILREGDLVIGNLETPLAGEDDGGFTGYPLFNAPEVLAKNLKEAGFSLVSTANNHSLDRRYRGLCATLDHLDEAGLSHTGTFRTQEERNQILYMEVKGVKVAAIAATYGANGLSLPGDKAFALNFIDEAMLLADIRRARQEGARYVIVMLHWGVEYQGKPGQDQTDLAYSLLRGGADLILGNHPHVLQRGEAVPLADVYASASRNAAPESQAASASRNAAPESQAASASRNAAPASQGVSDKSPVKMIMYSQGNFVSNQDGLDRLCSLLLKLTIGVDGATGEPYLLEAGYIPVYTQKRDRQGFSRHTVWPLELALAELEAGGRAFGADDRANIPRAWERVIQSQPALTLLSLKETPVWETLTGVPDANADTGAASPIADLAAAS